MSWINNNPRVNSSFNMLLIMKVLLRKIQIWVLSILNTKKIVEV